ncbi:MAG: hypothetical protein F4048_03425 [Gammaproteobacteria bacterium]|nr:hypothetical protein [Gammaproteobacteria bacterium]
MRVFFDGRLGDVQDLISFSDTLVCAQEHYPDAVDYRPGAKLPIDFRKLSESEVTEYTGSLDELSIEDELNFAAFFHSDLKSERALEFKPFLSLSPVVALDPSIDDASHPSITVDHESNLRLGLHVDSWDGLDMAARWKSRNRIVVNGGPGERYLYLVPVPIEAMAERIESPKSRHPSEVADLYLQSARRIPCLRILQAANVAYVCSTERLVHDACVPPTSERSESRHYLGHFVKS